MSTFRTAVSDRGNAERDDLSELAASGLLERIGMTGRAASYVIAVQTRHKPAKPAIAKTRHKPAKRATAAGKTR
jgi:hypothetical protein